jgi:hypothetical protein
MNNINNKFITICDRHGKIIDWAKDIQKFKVSDYDKPENMLNDIQRLAIWIEEETYSAKESGSDMEYRLNEYYDAIKSLGFERIK